MNRTLRVVLGAVVAVLLAGDAAAYTQIDASDYPSHWDPRIAKLVTFVEDARHLRFDHPVPVEFLSEAEYKKTNQTDASKLSPQEKQDLRTFEGQAHALGLVGKDVDLLKQLNTLSSEGTLAYYDDGAEKMVIRGTQLNVSLRVTVVHELTHALQDQNFDIGRDLASDGADSFFQGIIEGDATRIENAYIDSLSDSDQDEYYAEDDASRSDADTSLAGVPPALLELFGAPYDLGEPLTELVVDQRHVQGLNKLFRHPPDSDEGLVNPFAALDGEHAKKVKRPALKAGERKTDTGDFGVVPWFVVLSSYVDPHVALAAVDGWGGDSYVGYRKDGRPCIRIAFEGDTPNDVVEMTTALTQWKAAFTENSVQVSSTPGRVELDTCEPNAVPKARADSENALALPVTRLALLNELSTSNIPRPLAECVTRNILATVPLSTLTSDSDADAQRVFGAAQQIARGCQSGQLK